MDRRRLLLLLPLVIAACGVAPQAEKSVDSGKGYTVKTIDGCEYIEVSNLQGTQYSTYSLTHKGNCKNPIHRCPATTTPETKE